MLVVVSWRGTFVVLGIASLLWLVVWAWYFRNDPREHGSITAADLAALPAPMGARRAVPWLRLARRILPVTVVDWTAHPAIVKQGDDGRQTNTLGVQVRGDEVIFSVNGDRRCDVL